MEVWWNVIDELEKDQNALVACALICSGWAKRSMRLLGEPIKFDSPDDVRSFAKREYGHFKGDPLDVA